MLCCSCCTSTPGTRPGSPTSRSASFVTTAGRQSRTMRTVGLSEDDMAAVPLTVGTGLAGVLAAGLGSVHQAARHSFSGALPSSGGTGGGGKEPISAGQLRVSLSNLHLLAAAEPSPRASSHLRPAAAAAATPPMMSPRTTPHSATLASVPPAAASPGSHPASRSTTTTTTTLPALVRQKTGVSVTGAPTEPPQQQHHHRPGTPGGSTTRPRVRHAEAGTTEPRLSDWGRLQGSSESGVLPGHSAGSEMLCRDVKRMLGGGSCGGHSISRCNSSVPASGQVGSAGNVPGGLLAGSYKSNGDSSPGGIKGPGGTPVTAAPTKKPWLRQSLKSIGAAAMAAVALANPDTISASPFATHSGHNPQRGASGAGAAPQFLMGKPAKSRGSLPPDAEPSPPGSGPPGSVGGASLAALLARVDARRMQGGNADV
jgi:hypothetical protein